MAKLTQNHDLRDELRYYAVFAVVVVVLAIVLSQVMKVAIERTLLPVLHPIAEETAEPLRVTNNDGTLSTGEKLQGWRNGVFFGVFVISWMAACGITVAALLRFWPKQEGTEP